MESAARPLVAPNVMLLDNSGVAAGKERAEDEQSSNVIGDELSAFHGYDGRHEVSCGLS